MGVRGCRTGSKSGIRYDILLFYVPFPEVALLHWVLLPVRFGLGSTQPTLLVTMAAVKSFFTLKDQLFKARFL